MRGGLLLRRRSLRRLPHPTPIALKCISVICDCMFMAKPPRSIDSYVRPEYTSTGRWAKQTQFKSEVIQYCRGIQSSSNNVLSMSKSTKVIIIGAPGIGKTSLLLRYCQDSFEKNYKSTIGVDFEVEKCMVLGQPLNLQLWDTAGAERFKGVTTNYFRGANAVVLVFDLSTFMFDETIEKTRDWLYEARENCSSDFELFLVGTKTDLVTNDRLDLIMPTIMEYALEYEAELWITSASTGKNVSDLFDRIAIISMENLILKELANLRKIELAHNQVATNSTLTRVKITEKNSEPETKRRTGCCSR